MRLNLHIILLLSTIVVASNAHGDVFPAGDFGFSTFLNNVTYTTGAYGGQGGNQTSSRFVLQNANNTLSISNLDYNDTGSSGAWMNINGNGGGTITVNLGLVNIRSYLGVIGSIASNNVNVNFDINDATYNFITVYSTGDAAPGIPAAPIVYAGSGGGTVTLSQQARILASGSNSANRAIYAVPSITFNHNSINNSIGLLDLRGGANVTLSNTGSLQGGITSTAGTLNVTLNSTGTITGAISNAGGAGTFTVGAAGNATLGSTVSGIPNFTINGALTSGGAISGANGTVSVGAAGTLSLGHAMSGSGIINNSGILNLNAASVLGLTGAVTNTGTIKIANGILYTNDHTGSNKLTFNGAGIFDNTTSGQFTNSGDFTFNGSNPNAVGFTGLFTNSGLLTLNASLNRANSTTNTGTINIASGTFTNTGALNGSGGTIQGAGAFTNNSPGTYSVTGSNAFNFTGLFTNTGTTNIDDSATRAYATTNTGTISIDSGKTFTNTGALDGSGGTMSGAGAFTNTSPGAYTVTGSNAFNFTGAFSNSGTVNVQGNASRSNATTNTGTIAIATNMTFTNNGALNSTGGTINGGGGLTNSSSGTFTLNTSNGLAFDGLFSNAGDTTINGSATRAAGAATTNTGTISIDSGTFTSSGVFDGSGGTLDGVGAFTNDTNGSYTITGDAALSFTGTFTNSGTTNINESVSRANTTNSTGTFSIASNKTFTNTGTMTLGVGTKTTVGAITGAGAFTNSGTFNFNDTAAYTATGGPLNFTGLLTNTGTFNVNQDLSRASNTTNSAGTFTVATTKTFTNTATFALSGGTLTSTGSFTNNEIFAFTSGTINGAGLFTNNDTINITAGTFAKATGTFTNSSTGIINISDTGALTVPAGFTNTGTTNINRSGNAFTSTYSGTTGAILNIGPVTASAFTTAGTISGIPTINIANGSSVTTSAAESITGVNSSFNIGTSSGGGAFATFVGAGSTLSGTGAINNYGTLTFNTSSSLTDGFSAVNMFSDSTLAFQGGASTTLVTTPITAGDSVTGTTLSITGATTLQTSTLINNIKTITVGTGATLQLNNGGQVTGNNTSGGRTINLAGTLTIGSGGSFTIGSSDIINGTTATNGIGNGGITNNGTLLIDGSDLTLGGAFTNGTTGVFTINGVPTLTFTGAVTNQGTLFATFNESNNIPQIVTSAVPNLAAGLIVIGYQDNYIAGGSYSFISGFSGALPGGVGAYSLPQPSTYIAGWSLTADTNSVDITVDRIGFGAVATDPEAKEIGYYLETLGENNPSQEILDLLNVLEHITDPAELNVALLALAIPEYVPLQALSMMQDVLNTVQGRIAHVRTGFSVGDVDSDRSVWVRPFVSSGRQQQKDNLQGYTARVNGFAFGADNDITDRILLGAAGSIAKSKVTDQITVNSITDISSYQAMIYGTVRSKSDAYLDWIIAGGVNNYHGTRGISTALLTAEYSGQQFTAKAIGSKSYVWKKYYQLTPLASAQYSFLRQTPYSEVGSGFGRVVTPSNVNLLELGVGGQASVPFSQKKVTSIPEIHAMVLVDVKGGAIDTNSQFISGGPIISTTVQPGRLIGRIGASLTFAVSDRLQVIANYDFETRSKYISNEVYVNVKYTF